MVPHVAAHPSPFVHQSLGGLSAFSSLKQNVLQAKTLRVIDLSVEGAASICLCSVKMLLAELMLSFLWFHVSQHIFFWLGEHVFSWFSLFHVSQHFLLPVNPESGCMLLATIA